MLAILKNTLFMLWLLGALASLSVASTIFAIQAMATSTRLAAEVATTAVKHRKEMTRVVAQVKAKARLKRTIAKIPIAGMAAGAYFEEQEYQEWLISNPSGSRQEYLCEVSAISLEVVEEVLLELPQKIRPSEAVLSEMIPKCEGGKGI